MKKIFTIIALTVLFNTNAQIDDNSSDVSATGSFSVAMGYNTEASGIVLQQWEKAQQQVEILLQQWEMHNSKWSRFYSNGRKHNSK